MSGPWEKFQAQAQQEGPWTKFAKPSEPEKKEGSIIGDIAAGAVRGAGSIGATILAPVDAAARAVGIQNSFIGRTDRREAMDEGLRTLGADTDSLSFKGGKLATEIAGTAGAGGVIANGIKAVAPSVVAASPVLTKAVEAIASGGFRTGAPVATTTMGRIADMGIRSAGGGMAGATAAGLVDPAHALEGGAVGAIAPPAIAGIGAAGRYAANATRSLVQPFTAAGQSEIAGKVLRQFADGGPVTVNASQVVPGSVPTLAEATGNAGLATLQRGIRDVRPNAFIEREAQNAGARAALFDEVAGDAGTLDFFRASRTTAADDLYSRALDKANQQPLTPYLKGQITQLVKRPSVDDASRTAQRWAIERGEKPSAMGSLQALHDVKTAIDDKIGEAVRKGAGGEAKALESTKAKLLNVMEKLSPDYAEARHTYAEMSGPINAMEALQGLRLTDARGNITLAKVQNAIRGLESQRNVPGANAAKSITAEQINALAAIRDDLLRQDNLGLGRSIGSNTFQNLATDNILNSVAGNALSRLADRLGVAGAVGQVGRLAYSGPNEAIRNRIADLMLAPQLAEPLLQPQLAAPNAFSRFLADPRVQQPLYRAGPVLVTGQ